MPTPRYFVHRTDTPAVQAATLYVLASHGQVCLHTEDPALFDLLESRGIVTPRRPPYLDAAAGHDDDAGAANAHDRAGYRSRHQINTFFRAPLDDVVRSIREPLEESGYILSEFPVER